MPPHFSSILRRKALAARGRDDGRCSSCRRVPLAGEMMHELESHSLVCELCLARLPASKRTTLGAVRVHVCERPLAIVVPRAA
jgi:hypothetical protein